MARHPDWFDRLDSILEVLRQAETFDAVGRKEVQALFGASERDSIRLLHKFGAVAQDDALSLPRAALLAQLEAIRAGSTYAAFLRQRQQVAGQLRAARAATAARQFHVQPPEPRISLAELPQTITWRRAEQKRGTARFEIIYLDGADLMRQLAAFLTAAGLHRDEFVAATEPAREP